MHIKGNRYLTRIPTIATGEDGIKREYQKGEIFEGNPMDSENPVNFDYIPNSDKTEAKEKNKTKKVR